MRASALALATVLLIGPASALAATKTTTLTVTATVVAPPTDAEMEEVTCAPNDQRGVCNPPKN